MSNTDYLNNPEFLEHAKFLWDQKLKANETKKCKCSMCLGEYEYKERGMERNFLGNKKVWEINLGRGGYDSIFDNRDINFELCDKCLYGLIISFPEETREKAAMHMSTYDMESIV